MKTASLFFPAILLVCAVCQKNTDGSILEEETAPKPDTSQNEQTSSSQEEVVYSYPEKVTSARTRWKHIRDSLTGKTNLAADQVLYDSSQDSLKIDSSYILPAEYPGLPVNIAMWLDEKGYVIPQSYKIMYEFEMQNAISGEFITAGKTDWVVLTSDLKTMRLIIFPEGSLEHASNIMTKSDSLNWYVDDGYTVKYDFSTLATYDYILYKYTKKELLKITENNPEMELPSLTHNGLELYLVDKASSIYYYDGNEWITTPFLD